MLTAAIVTGGVIGAAACATACDDGPWRDLSKAVSETKIEPVSIGPISTTDTVTVSASGAFVEVGT